MNANYTYKNGTKVNASDVQRANEKYEKINNIKNAVEKALSKYDTENVDIIKCDGVVDIMYHSRHNSFSIISNVCTSRGLSEADIEKIADNYDIGYCW